MVQITGNASLVAQLRGVCEPVELVDEAGRSLGTFIPATEPAPLTDSPYSLEELAAMEAETTGKPLEEIRKRLVRQ